MEENKILTEIDLQKGTAEFKASLDGKPMEELEAIEQKLIKEFDEVNERRKNELEQKRHSAKLKSSLAIPSATNSYSISVAYIKDWFLNKVGRNFFNARI